MNERRSKTKTYITFSQAANRLPTRPASVTIWRWATKGIKAPDGSVVKLKHARFGGKLMTTAQWLDQFGLDMAQAFEAPQSTDRPRIPTHAEAERILSRRGI